ncbi:heparan-sulfate 6-O-sulfotransferase 2-like [Styela clava]
MRIKWRTPLQKMKFWIGVIIAIIILFDLKAQWNLLTTTVHLETKHRISGKQSNSMLSNTSKQNEQYSYPPENFQVNGSDIMVQLHIQKTGGSKFEFKIIRDLQLQRNCRELPRKKTARCFRPNSQTEQWLFSRQTTKWACGVHADWTSLTECIGHSSSRFEMKKNSSDYRYFYITLLRNPIQRYISEWIHVKRGGTWKTTKYVCKGQRSYIPRCYSGTTWSDVSLSKFIECQYNMANNRETRMLADLKLVECYKMFMTNETYPDVYNVWQRNMLNSAKQNLESMAFFAITERMEESQMLFEHKFGLRFQSKMEQWNKTNANTYQLTKREMEQIKRNNQLDMELYEFAVKLFNKRLSFIKTQPRIIV